MPEYVYTDVEASIAVGHDGMVHIVSNPDRRTNIEKLYESLYNDHKARCANSELARVHTLDRLNDMGLFDYESR